MKRLPRRRRDTGPSDTRYYGYVVLLATGLVAALWGVIKCWDDDPDRKNFITRR